MAAAADGDAAAFGELVTRHQEAAFRLAWLLTRSAADAEDAAQEAFVKAYLALDRFTPGAPFRPWLLAIVGNEARNRIRSRARREGVLARILANARGGTARSTVTPEPVGAPVAPSPEAQVTAGETWAEVRGALDGLREEERRVVSCRFLLGLSEAETAAALGIPVGTVKSRLARGLRRMRVTLETLDGAGLPEVRL